jgi:hypothetical protein
MTVRSNSSTGWGVFSRKSLSSAALRSHWMLFVFWQGFFKIVEQVNGDIGFQSQPIKLLQKVVQEIQVGFACGVQFAEPAADFAHPPIALVNLVESAFDCGKAWGGLGGH